MHRISLDVDDKTHFDTKVKVAKQRLAIADVLRAFLRAFLRDDPRALKIVEEYSDKKAK